MAKNWTKILPYITAISIAAVVVAGGWRITTAQKATVAELNALIDSQKATIGQLAAERDNLKSQPVKTNICPPVIPSYTATNPVEDVLAPEPEAGDYQTRIDALKKNYEETLVTYFVLKKCGGASDVQYHIITSALSQEMASLNAPGRLQYDILTSALGSYNELYSGNACDEKILVPLREQFKTFIDSVSQNFVPK